MWPAAASAAGVLASIRLLGSARCHQLPRQSLKETTRAQKSRRLGAYAGLDLGCRRSIVDALVTIRVNPVGKGTARVFDPDAIVNGKRVIDVVWKEDL